jgi:hypothetical protein
MRRVATRQASFVFLTKVTLTWLDFRKVSGCCPSADVFSF